MISLEVIGRIGKEGEIRQIGQNQAFCFSVAHDEKVGGQKVTTWIDVVFFKIQSNIIQYLKSGAMVRAIGKAQWRAYTDKTGSQRVGVSVYADDVSMILFAKSEQKTQYNPLNPNQPTAQQVAEASYESVGEQPSEYTGDLPF